MDFSASDVAWIWDTCIGVLYLGNVCFEAGEGGEGSRVLESSTNSLNMAAFHLKVLYVHAHQCGHFLDLVDGSKLRFITIL